MLTITELAIQLSETYPNIAITQYIDAAIDQAKNANVMTISAELEVGLSLTQAVAACAKVSKNRLAVIWL